MITGKYTFSLDELRLAHRNGWKEIADPRAGIFLLLLSIGLITSAVTGFERLDHWIIIYLSALALLLLLLRPMRNLMLGQQFAKRSARNMEIRIEATQDGIKWTGSSFQTAYSWSMVTKGIRNKDGFLLFRQDGFLLFQNQPMVNWLPNHAFASASDIEGFAALLASKLSDYKETGVTKATGHSA